MRKSTIPRSALAEPLRCAQSARFGRVPMAMPQRDDLIEEIKRTDLLLEWAVQHGDEAEAERLREKLRKLTEM